MANDTMTLDALAVDTRRDKPLYAQLADALRARILDGEYAPDTILPSEHDLCQHFKVSQITVRRALLDLQKDGKVYRRQGRGTFVAEPDAKRRGTGQVQLLVANQSSSHFYGDLFQTIAHRMQMEHRGVVLSQIAGPMPDSSENMQLLDRLIDTGSDALVVQGYNFVKFDRLIERRSEIRNLMIIDIDESLASFEAHRVLFDYEAATHLAASHLLAAGRRRLAFISGNRFGDLHQHTLYKRGILRALAEHGLDEASQAWFVPKGRVAESKEMEIWLRRILSNTDRPDGIVCMWDALGVLAIRAAKRLGLRVPEDLMVTGMFDTPWSTACEVPITTIHFDAAAMADAVAERLDRTNSFDTAMIAPRLVVRESTGDVQHADEEHMSAMAVGCCR